MFVNHGLALNMEHSAVIHVGHGKGLSIIFAGIICHYTRAQASAERRECCLTINQHFAGVRDRYPELVFAYLGNKSYMGCQETSGGVDLSCGLT